MWGGGGETEIATYTETGSDGGSGLGGVASEEGVGAGSAGGGAESGAEGLGRASSRHFCDGWLGVKGSRELVFLNGRGTVAAVASQAAQYP